jgi:Rrf2 family protein
VKLSTQEEYGLRLLLQMARHEEKSLTLSDLSRLEGLSQPNVAKLMRTLRKAGFVKSTRGQSGGYTLARPSEDVRVSQVLGALGERLYDATFCDRHAGAHASCTHSGDCSIRPVLMQVQLAIDQVLNKLTLGQLLCSEIEMRSRAGPKAIPLSVVEVRTS